jgi:hypothetical protein
MPTRPRCLFLEREHALSNVSLTPEDLNIIARVDVVLQLPA